jgi:hypothetical protein
MLKLPQFRIIYWWYENPAYVDKLGMPLIRNLNQLVLTTAQGRRVWLMTHGGDSPEAKSSVHTRGCCVVESGGQCVFQYKGRGSSIADSATRILKVRY